MTILFFENKFSTNVILVTFNGYLEALSKIVN